MIGIYKITSPSNKVYIGQSINIKKRFSSYKRLECKSQIALYNSFSKYTFEKHNFEILCECEIHELNDKERYYQDLYNVNTVDGLNCKLTGGDNIRGELSKESRIRISKSIKGKKPSEETRLKMSNSRKGKKFSDETKHAISTALKGRKFSEETIEKIRYSAKNISEETRKKMSDSAKAKSHEVLKNNSDSQKKIIINLENGVFYFGIKEAAESGNIKYGTLKMYLSGGIKNKSKMVYA